MFAYVFRQTEAMSTNSPERLAHYVRARRAELDLNQLDVWQAGGPSNTTQTEIENGRVRTLTRTTARKLDAGLRWEPGSARRVWDDGGEPIPVSAQRPSDVEVLRRRILEARFLSDDQKREILATLAPADESGVRGDDSSAAS